MNAFLKQKPAVVPMDLRAHVRDVADFPKPGIVFRDISPLLRDHFAATMEAMCALLTADAWRDIDVIGGIEARGFILAAALAAMQGKGLVPIRKAGKLPSPVVSRAYGLEYGEDRLEMQYGQGRMLVVDDVLATGGTLAAAAELASESGYVVSGFACLINLTSLNQFVWRGMPPGSVLDYV